MIEWMLRHYQDKSKILWILLYIEILPTPTRVYVLFFSNLIGLFLIDLI